METIKCVNCGIENEAHEEITSGLKLSVLTAICKCGQLNIKYKDKLFFIPSNLENKETGILRFKHKKK